MPCTPTFHETEVCRSSNPDLPQSSVVSNDALRTRAIQSIHTYLSGFVSGVVCCVIPQTARPGGSAGKDAESGSVSHDCGASDLPASRHGGPCQVSCESCGYVYGISNPDPPRGPRLRYCMTSLADFQGSVTPRSKKYEKRVIDQRCHRLIGSLSELSSTGVGTLFILEQSSIKKSMVACF